MFKTEKKGFIMYKQLFIATTLLIFLSGCVTKEVVYQPLPQNLEPTTLIEAKESHTFAGETLTATHKVSKLVRQIKQRLSDTAYVDLNANQNIELGHFLNIRATPNLDGFLKLMVIDPNGDRKLVLPNTVHRGYLKANQTFYSNNEQFTLQTTKPRGLHYVMVIFTQNNARMQMQQGVKGYDALHNDQDLLDLLQNIQHQHYGKSHVALFPLRIY